LSSTQTVDIVCF